MSHTNREVQLRKTCQLYAYVLASLGKEIPEAIQECAHSYDYPVECVKELSQTLQDLDSETFDKIVHKSQSQVARDLEQWWEMYQIYIPV
jgi:hypothetical protein